MPELDQIRAVFNEAAELSGDRRREYLDGACKNQPELRDRVEALLTAAEKEDDFLASPTDVAAFSSTTPVTSLTERPGTQIGPYKLLQTIGEGGFGTVFMAEQERPIRRRVALKIIKLGMDTKAIVARFEAERQALAMMDHPSIATVLDAGATDTGRPYFVMELVHGVPITTFCDERRLPIVERLELFEQVCHAVQHAHTKGIIHRDLKPSNILVTVVAGDRPLPKVIDFGIAKATNASLTEQTLFTEHRAFIGTPEYMSPEQALAALDVDMRTDVYSLGVILYELLTGTTPFERSQLRRAALIEMQRILRDVEPPIPSTRLSQSGQTLPSIAASRHCDSRRLDAIVRGDLDWIAMKALDKDPRRRYETTNDLSGDVRRFLQGKAVHAAPPSAVYRFQKLFRRHRGKFLLGGAAAMAVLLLSVVASIGWSRATRAWERAARERSEKETALLEAREHSRQARAAEAAAESARLATVREKENAEEEAYLATIVAADTSLLLDEPQRVRDWIEAAPALARGWEWSYLRARADSSLWSAVAHRAGVNAIAVSPDGSRVLTGGSDYSVAVLDARSGVRTFSYLGHAGPVRTVSISPDGMRVVSTSSEAARVWDLLTGDDLRILPAVRNATMRAAEFTPDGRSIVVATSDGTIHVWDAESFQLHTAFPTHNSEINDMAVSADLLATASCDGTARVWRLPEGAPVATFARHKRAVRCVRLSPDGKQAVSTADSEPAWLWDAQTGMGIVMLDDDANRITSVAFSPDGKHIAATAGARVLLLDITTGQRQRWLRGHTDVAQICAISADNRRMYSGARDGAVLAWDASTKQYLERISASRAADCPNMWSPDGEHVVVCPANHAAAVWHLPTGRCLLVCGDRADSASYAWFTPDGSRIVTQSEDEGGAVWDAETGEKLLTLIPPSEMAGLHAATLIHARISYSADGMRLIAPGEGNTTEVWDRTTGRRVAILEGHTASVNYATFSPDGVFMLTVSDDRTATLWNASTLQSIRTLSGHEDAVHDTKFGLGGKQIATFSRDRTIRVWNTDDGRLASTIYVGPQSQRIEAEPTRAPDANNARPEDAIFSPDESRLLVPMPTGEWMVWDIQGASEVCRIRQRRGRHDAIAFSPDNHRIVFGSGNALAVVLDAESGRELLSLRGHSEQVVSCSFSPDGTWVVTSASNGELRIWDSVPVNTRIKQWDQARETEATVRAYVEQMMNGKDVAAVRDAIAADRTLRREQRSAAQALVTDAVLREAANAAGLNDAVNTANDTLSDERAAGLVNEARARVRQNPNDGELVHTLGVALYRAHRFAEAISAFHRSEALIAAQTEDDPAEPQMPDNWAYIVMAHAEQGEVLKARAGLKVLRKLVLAAHASHPRCRDLLRTAETAIENPHQPKRATR